MKYIFLCIFIIEVCHCQNETIYNESTTVSLNDPISYISDFPEKTAVIRKCCQQSYFLNSTINECSEINDDSVFLDYTNALLKYNNYSLRIIPKEIDNCPGTYHQLEKMMVPYDLSIQTLFNDSVYNYSSDLLFNWSYYCFEMFGPTVESSELVLAYCLGPQKVITKCCPQGHYFDTRVPNCSPYYNEAEPSNDLSFLKFFDDGLQLSPKKFQCNETFVKYGINETYFKEDHLCISKSHLCYNSNEFCVDNMLKGENKLVTEALICPYNFINKCCPDGQSLHELGCIETHNNSLSLKHFPKTLRYKIKSPVTNCTPVILEDNAKSNIKWSFDIKGFAIIKTPFHTISTRNFCFDDFTSEHEVSPAIYVCSEEVNAYYEESSIKDMPDDVLGKCCPRNTYYYSKTGEKAQCLEISDERLNYLEDELFKDFNISDLIYSYFPNCSVKKNYHKYDLFLSDYDYGKITKNHNLEIISKDNNCIRKITEVDRSKFCVDFFRYDERYKPIAIVCVPIETFHSERNAIVASFIGISCTALILAFFSIIFTRVRRGMVTDKKINTLAGRILTSYVLSQLVGYLALVIATLAGFEEGTDKCFVLAGFLMFFMIASFFWNTSICLEGLLLTMHVQMSENRRYICHSAWSWGVPAIITAIAIVLDTHRDSLGCDVITPKIGVERCFFSDAVAQLLYFYLPIGITVFINAFLLIYAKILRKNILKNLGKDPNRVRRNENLQQILSIKSIRSKLNGESSIKPPSNHSGLRTHHNRNLWVESLKLVLWSGTTWLMEIIGTLVTMYRGRSQEEWYNYLWYIPVGFNCLRGLGIFVIISFNAENKNRVLRTAKILRIGFSTKLSKIMPSLTQRKKSVGNDSYSNSKEKSIKQNTVQFSTRKTQDSKLIKPTKQRSTSVTTIMTNISSTYDVCTSEGDGNGENTLQVPSFSHSISQVDDKVSSASSTLPNAFESFQSDSDSNEDKKEDQVSLDNTSMENLFWENELQARRNAINLLNVKNNLEEKKDNETVSNSITSEAIFHNHSLEETKYDETLPNLFTKEATNHSNLEENKDDEKFLNVITKEATLHQSDLEEKKDCEFMTNLITKEATLHPHPSEEKKDDEMVSNLISKESAFRHPNLEEKMDDETSSNLITKEATLHPHPSEEKKEEEIVSNLITKEATLHPHPSEEKKDDEMVSNLISKESAFRHPNLEEKMDDETSSNLITKEATLHPHPSEEKKDEEIVSNLITKESAFHHPNLEEI
ncbi:UNVERIFIED_CONTAM: hypothetical protein RMT77_005133 [Armadillidium vulgare]